MNPPLLSVAAQSLQSCLTLRPHGLQTARFLCSWIFPGKNTAMGCHTLLQGIYPTQGSKLHLLHCRWGLYHWATGKSHILCSCIYIYINNAINISWQVEKEHCLVSKFCPLCDPMECSPLSSSVHGNFLRHQHRHGLPFSPPGDLPGPGIEPTSPVAPALQADSLPLSHLSSFLFFWAYFPTCDLKSIKNF